MSKSPSPASIRLIVAVILIICGTVVQGISAHLESNVSFGLGLGRGSELELDRPIPWPMLGCPRGPR